MQLPTIGYRHYCTAETELVNSERQLSLVSMLHMILARVDVVKDCVA